MAGYSELQEREFAMQEQGFRAVKHQGFVGTGFFDAIQNIVTAGQSSAMAMQGSTEVAPFTWIWIYIPLFGKGKDA